MMEAIIFSETSIPARTTRCNIPEDAILHSHRRENFKSHITAGHLKEPENIFFNAAWKEIRNITDRIPEKIVRKSVEDRAPLRI
jgi:hypothetical protein